jgi:twitching motility protein PilT
MKLDKIFRTALEYKASDIYISSGAKPVLRINGQLVIVEEHAELSNETAKDYLVELMGEREQKEYAEKLDTDFSIEVPGVARFRVNIFTHRRGISGIFRLIPSTVSTMEDLSMPDSMKKITQMHNGLVLITGPAGSGKSTTLASIINEINTTSKKHIITIEDPIEFVHTSNQSIIEQREVKTHAEGFERGLRAALREDPNVVLIGEMRDLDTIALAITAAETGHLVLATLHTSGAAKTVDRIIDAFPGGKQNQIRTQLADVLRAVVWQQLLKRNDGDGRIAAYEILFMNNASSNLVREGKTYQIPSVIETGVQEGMQTMKQALIDLLQKGLISEEEAQLHMPQEVA